MKGKIFMFKKITHMKMKVKEFLLEREIEFYINSIVECYCVGLIYFIRNLLKGNTTPT